MKINSTIPAFNFDCISDALHGTKQANSCDALLFDDKHVWFIEFKSISSTEEKACEIRESLKMKPIFSLYLLHRCLVDSRHSGDYLDPDIRFLYYLVVDDKAIEVANDYSCATLSNPSISCENHLGEFSPLPAYHLKDDSGNGIYFDEVKAFTKTQFEYQIKKFRFPAQM